MSSPAVLMATGELQSLPSRTWSKVSCLGQTCVVCEDSLGGEQGALIGGTQWGPGNPTLHAGGWGRQDGSDGKDGVE